jgi:hypothetical protein
VNPNTMKSGNEPGEEPKDDKPAEEPKGEDKSRPNAAYLRVMFGITNRARGKMQQPARFLEWIDRGFVAHRDEWRHLWGDKPFPFEDTLKQFKAAAEHYSADQLPAAIEAICTNLEESWNAE